MQICRIGVVNYLNTVPLIAGLEKANALDIIPAAPALIAGLLTSDPPTVDIGLVSLLAIPRSSLPLTVLPVGMIGCRGPTLTVRLYSQVPLDQVTTLHADTDSTTSTVLARLLLRCLHGACPTLIDFDARERISSPVFGDGAAEAESWPEAMVLIGDKVVTDSPPAVRYPHQMDLGEAWFSLTGKPFVYAVWACRSADLESEDLAPAIHSAAALLDRARRRNTQRLDAIITEHAARTRWPIDLARRYLTELLRYEVTPDALRAAQDFINAAAEQGFVPPATLRTTDA